MSRRQGAGEALASEGDSRPGSPIRICFVTTTLLVGGAQMMLFRLLEGLDRRDFAPHVVSMVGGGPVAERIRELGVPVTDLGMPRAVPDPRGALRLARYLRGHPFDVVQTWMYHANLLGGLTARLVADAAVVWGIRQADLSRRAHKVSTRLVIRAGAWISRHVPDVIVACGEETRRTHVAHGYDARKMIVIPNGFDVEEFAPDPQARCAVRRELGLQDDIPVVGIVGRYHPQKDHANFVRAASRVGDEHPRVRFLMVGPDVCPENRELSEMIRDTGHQDRFLLLGRRDDVPELMSAMDIYVSSSRGEGFPGVVGEAMATGLPCVVTDVGDSGRLVGEGGRVVPPEDPAALAEGVAELLSAADHERLRMGRRARRRIAGRYSREAFVARYERCYRSLCAA